MYPYTPAPPFRLGPRAREVSQVDIHTALLGAQSQMDAKKKAARDRYRIFTSSFHDLIAGRIDTTRREAETKRSLWPFGSVALNVAMDITSQVCMVWRHGARREVVGATPAENDALRRLIVEFGLDYWGPVWNRLAFLVGPIVVAPVNRKGRMRPDTIRPDFADHYLDPDDPAGTPIASAWPNTPVHSRDEVSHVVLDTSAWTYYSAAGSVVGIDLHGLVEYPGAELRMSHPLSDWYGDDNTRIVEVTLDVAVINATLQAVRKAQHHKIVAAIGDISLVPKQQILDTEGGIALDTGARGSSAVSLNVLDYETLPDSFIRHIMYLKEEAIEAFGIPSHAITFDYNSGDPGERLRVTHEGLTDIREQQIPFARAFEHDLVRKLVASAKATGHALADDLPDPGLVRTGYRVQYPRLGRAFNDPSVEMAYTDWQISKGFTSRKEEFRRRNVDVIDEQQIDDLFQRYLDEEQTWNDEMARRNMSPGADLTPREESGGSMDQETAAQINGRDGGREKARNVRREEG